MTRITKVIVIGLDGLEPKIVEPMLAHGELPNLARIRAAGGYARCRTTIPAQTPVAWSTFATGVNPGGHGIFDFIRRDPATYLPDFALERPPQTSAAPTLRWLDDDLSTRIRGVAEPQRFHHGVF